MEQDYCNISNVYILYRIKNGIMYILFEINHNLYLLKEKDLYNNIYQAHALYYNFLLFSLASKTLLILRFVVIIIINLDIINDYSFIQI